MTASFSVKECLRGYTSVALGDMCARWQLAVTAKPNRIRAIEKVLGDPLHVRRVLDQLKPEAVRLLHLVAGREAAAASDVLSVPGLFANGQAAAVLRDVAHLGLVLVCPHDRAGAFSFSDLPGDQHANGSPTPLAVPRMVAKYLPEPSPLGVKLRAAPAPATPDGPADAEKATAAFLETLRAVDVLAPRVTAAGTIHKTDLARAQALASEAEVTRDALSLALTMAWQMGCFEVRNGRLATTARAGQWAASRPADRIRELFQAYLESEEIPDLRLFFPQIGDAVDEHLPRGSARRTYHKRLAAAILSEQDVKTWRPVEALGETVRQIDSNVLFLEERWRAVRSHARDANAAWKLQSWRTHEERLFLWMVRSLMGNAGMVQLGDEGKAFRLTPLGRYALGAGPRPADNGVAARDALVVQPDFEVIAYLDRCPADLRWELDTFCERLGGDAVRTYRLTQESVYRGVRSGSSTAHFVQVLEGHSIRSLPSNVRAQLATWERKVEAITIRTGRRLAECTDAGEADELAGLVTGSRRLGDRFVLLPEGEDIPEALEQGAKFDYGQPQPACLIQEDGLALRARWREWGLLLKRRLADVGEVSIDPGGDMVVRLTRDTVLPMTDWGLLAAELETYAVEPLAARYREALRAWAGDVEPAQSATALLVRFADPDTCQAAMEVPEASDCVEGRLGLNTVVVRKGCLVRFKQALKAYGISVKPAALIETDGPPEEWAVPYVENLQTPDDNGEPEPPTSKKAEKPETNGYTLPSYSPRITREILQDAIERRRPVLILYQSPWAAEPGVRRVNPVSLDVYSASPTLSGYCHVHGGARTFKLARIAGIRLLEDDKF